MTRLSAASGRVGALGSWLRFCLFLLKMRFMPSSDIVSQVNPVEIENSVKQAKKELANRFDFKGAAPEILLEKNEIKLRSLDQCIGSTSSRSRRSPTLSSAGWLGETSASRTWDRAFPTFRLSAAPGK